MICDRCGKATRHAVPVRVRDGVAWCGRDCAERLMRNRAGRGVLSNPAVFDRVSEAHDIPRSVIYRAIEAGAMMPLKYIGFGVEGVVFREGGYRGHAFKVCRGDRPTCRDEAEWLMQANRIPSIRQHVARVYAYHEEPRVIEREYVAWPKERVKRHPGRKQRTDLTKLHDMIRNVMFQYGWIGPEMKHDSYVLARGRGWVLIDAGFVERIGSQLARYAVELMQGKRKPQPGDTPKNLAQKLRAEALLNPPTIPKDIAERLAARLGKCPAFPCS